MSTDIRNVRFKCPNCVEIIGPAPEGVVPTGEPVCPNCGSCVNAPNRFDKVVEEFKEIVTGSLGSRTPRGRRRPSSSGRAEWVAAVDAHHSGPMSGFVCSAQAVTIIPGIWWIRNNCRFTGVNSEAYRPGLSCGTEGGKASLISRR